MKHEIRYVIDTPACDEKIYASRGFREIEDDKQLIEYAKKVSNNWFDAGHCLSFMSFYLGGYDFQRNFTYKEMVRLYELQDREIEEYDSKYEWARFLGKPLTEEQIVRFLDRQIERTKKQFGEDDFRYESMIKAKENRLEKWRNGEIIEVDSDCDAYNDRWLYSDGTVREQHWGD